MEEPNLLASNPANVHCEISIAILYPLSVCPNTIRPVASNVSPGSYTVFAGKALISIPEIGISSSPPGFSGLPTVILQPAVFPLQVAVIVAVPSPTAITLTDVLSGINATTLGLSHDQLTAVLGFILLGLKITDSRRISSTSSSSSLASINSSSNSAYTG